MTTKINLTELLADREAGTGGEWHCDYDDCGLCVFTDDDNYVASVYAGAAQFYVDEGELPPLARRIARLPALEAAYIEAVGLLAEVREHLADGNIGKAIVRIDRGPLVGDAQ